LRLAPIVICSSKNAPLEASNRALRATDAFGVWPLLSRHAAQLAALTLTLLAPPECAACDAPVALGVTFCAKCGVPRPLPASELGGVPLFCAGAYTPPLSLAIGRLKFERRSDLAKELARGLIAPLGALGLQPMDAFVPVPLHRMRLVERGFNQAGLVARALARATGASFRPQQLERSRETAQQARLGRAEREANVHAAFHVRAPRTGGRIVLVDDVVTTGRTALACIESLREAGCEISAVVALARAGA
jgi:ComF family protein